MIYPLLPLFLTTMLGASRTFVGLAEGIAALPSSLLMGYLYQSFGAGPAFTTGAILAGLSQPSCYSSRSGLRPPQT